MPSWETTYVPSTDGVQVAMHDFGGDGRLLLFNHATGFCGHVWQPMIESLRSRFRCVAIDLRAHGHTVLPEGLAPVWRGMADDLTAVIDHLSPGEPVLAVGHSMGGTAIIMAETARRGLVDRAWTFEPILLPLAPVVTGEAGPDIARAARRRRGVFASRLEARQRYAGRPPLDRLDRRALDAYVEHGFVERADGTVALRCSPETEAAVFEHHNTGADLLIAGLGIPFLVAVGRADDGPAAQAIAAVGPLSGVRVVEYPDLTHFGPLEEPDRLAVDVERFFMGEIGTEEDG
ncbi:MAG: alpha/beta fold hydrolase [Acidimicrobiales bacterium]